MESLYLNLDFKYFLKNKSSSTIFESQNGIWTQSHLAFMNYSDSEIIENLTPVKQVIDKLNIYDGLNHIDLVDPTFDCPTMTLCFSGTKEFINYSRSLVLKLYTNLLGKTVELSSQQSLKIVNDIDFLQKLNQLSAIYKVEVIVNTSNIMIFGGQDNVTMIETQVRVLIDSMLNKYFIDSVDVNLSMIPLIGGPSLLNFTEIALQLKSNIYLPDLFPDIFNSGIYTKHENFKIWISAEKVGQILNTKATLEKLISTKEPTFYTKSIQVSKEKLDLLLLSNQMQLLNIMFENSTFIELPKLGDSSNCITIQGPTQASVTDSIKDIYLMTSRQYKLLINNENTMRYQQILDLLVKKFKLIAKLNMSGLEIVGDRAEIRRFLNIVNSNDINMKTQLIIEISNEHKDFISGKKNGKILKILNQVEDNAVFKFLNLDEYNFLCDIIIENAINLNSLIHSMDLIENELPSEMKFNIPEMFHKSIIGNGGLIIQSIMKMYNVYIKFSSQNKDSTNGGNNYYGFNRVNNVLIKCPTKNARNIQLVKDEIDSLVENCCNNNLNNNYLNKNLNNSIYTSVDFKLLRAHYLLLINSFRLNNLNNLEIEYHSFVNWPSSYEQFGESNFKNISIKGSDIKLKFFINTLIDSLPTNYKIILSNNLRLRSILESEKFTDEIITPLRVFHNIELSVFTNSGNQELWMSYYPGANIEQATTQVSNYMKAENMVILDKGPIEFSPVTVNLNELRFDTEKKERRRVPRPLTRITNEV